ncbi:MAG: patatin-like phospholipase family protein [Bacteroidetes bacterium]|nr:patatin-like phospholipase family protein [Bacteroidota bacterium]
MGWKNYLKLGLCWLSLLLRATYLFFPTLAFIILAGFVFGVLPQGNDLLRLCLSSGGYTGLIFTISVLFWVFVTWYTARLLAYNHDELYDTRFSSNNAGHQFRIGRGLMYHYPRLMGYSIFLLVIISLSFFNVPNCPGWLIWGICGGNLAVYVLLHRFVDRIQLAAIERKKQELLVKAQNTCWIIIFIVTPLITSLLWQVQWKWFIVGTLFCCQICFLFLVISRKYVVSYQRSKQMLASGTGVPLFSRNLLRIIKKYFGWVLAPMQRFLEWVMNMDKGNRRATMRTAAETEQFIFILFNLLALIGGVCYLLAVFNIQFAQDITSVPLLFLAFAVLLGMGNFVSLLSYRLNINIHFLIVVLVATIGFITEPHWVRTLAGTNADYSKRMDLDNYIHTWLHSNGRAEKIAQNPKHFPVFIVLADGGASRSGYWTALVLSHLSAATDTGKQPFVDHLLCLSGASGGSVGHATFLAALNHEDIRNRHFRSMDSVTTDFLGNDFLSFTLARLFGPDFISPIVAPFIGDRATALEESLEKDSPNLLSKDMQQGFSRFIPTNNEKFLLPIVCFNTTRMQDGKPGVITNINLDSARFGTRIDVLDALPPEQDLRLSTAMLLSARFPYISPAGRIGNSYFVDGGYFDNSGAGVAHELLLGLEKMQQTGGTFGDSALLNKLQFYIIHVTNSPYGNKIFSKVHPFKNDFLAPLLTVAGSYSTQTSVNDTRLTRYLADRNRFNSTINVNLYLTDRKESFPMNWVMSDSVKSVMNDRVHHIAGLDSLIKRLNRGRTEKLLDDVEPNSAPDPLLSKSVDQPLPIAPIPTPQPIPIDSALLPIAPNTNSNLKTK